MVNSTYADYNSRPDPAEQEPPVEGPPATNEPELQDDTSDPGPFRIEPPIPDEATLNKQNGDGDTDDPGDAEEVSE